MHHSLADVFVGAESDIGGYTRLIKIEATSNLLTTLVIHLQLLLLGEVKLVHPCIALVGGESGDGVRDGVRISADQSRWVVSPYNALLLARLNIVTRNEVK